MYHNKALKIKILGVLFIGWGCAAIAKSIYLSNYEQLLWACWIGFVLIGIGTLKKNAWLVMSQLNILAIPWVIWSIDFVYYLLTRQSLWGITNYVFETATSTIDKTITIAHLVALPAALFALTLLEIKRKDAWKISLLQVTALFVIVIAFSAATYENNINCIHHPCIPLEENIPYPLMWFIGATTLVLITNQVLLLLFARKKERKL